MRPSFDHEKLKVYRSAIAFITWSTDLLTQVEARAPAKDHLEGNGKFAIQDRCRFLDFARGSALECAACLDVLVAKRLIEAERIRSGKDQLLEIVSMLVGLVHSLSARINEDVPSYANPEQKQEQEQE